MNTNCKEFLLNLAQSKTVFSWTIFFQLHNLHLQRERLRTFSWLPEHVTGDLGTVKVVFLLGAVEDQSIQVLGCVEQACNDSHVESLSPLPLSSTLPPLYPFPSPPFLLFAHPLPKSWAGKL